jgi:hypothetical protein
VELDRLMSRNLYTREEALQRIQSQMSVEEKRIKADILIDNSNTLEATEAQVDNVIKSLKSRRRNIFVYLLGFIPAAIGYTLLRTIQISHRIYVTLFY